MKAAEWEKENGYGKQHNCGNCINNFYDYDNDEDVYSYKLACRIREKDGVKFHVKRNCLCNRWAKGEA